MKNSLPYRQIHLDFHTSEHIEGVGAAFDPGEFVHGLKTGHVNSVTLFAKCHHGWSYYPTEIGKPHPHLERPDLLGEMITACRAANIQTPVYITVQWDELTAREHPEWRAVRAQHAAFQAMGKSGGDADLNMLDAQWHPLSLVHEELVNRIIAQSIEVVERYDPEGLFMDILLPWQDVGVKSLERMARRGLDPESETDRLRNDREVIQEYYERFWDALRPVKQDLRIFHNSGHIAKGDRTRWPFFTHLELESLPTGGWGYDHFPISAKYASTLGMEFLGMTGKFHTMWGEFGGYKRPVALDYECAQMVAMGARCSVGDQLHPSGRIDLPTYEIIGEAYRRVEALEPFLDGSTPVAEIALLSPESLGRSGDRDILEEKGAARMLLELQQMFDVVDTEADFSAYRLLVLPDCVTLEGTLLERVNAFLRAGGKVIASHRSLLKPDGSAFAVEFPATVHGSSPFQPDYLAAREDWDPDLVRSPFVVYERSMRVRGTGGSEAAAQIHDPYFNRSWRHFCSHQHAPARPEASGFAGILATENIVYFAHPLFTAFERSGQPLLKFAFRGALRKLLPDPLLRTNLPSSARASLSRQESPDRLLLHLLYAQTQLRGSGMPGWRGEQAMEILEDAVPLHDARISLRMKTAPARVYLAGDDADLPFDHRDGRLELTVETVNLHQLVVIEPGR
jgi:hypothetical protein